MSGWDQTPFGPDAQGFLEPGPGQDATGSEPNGTEPAQDRPGEQDRDEELVRPFVITGGRTRHATVHLRVEALVVASPGANQRSLQFEHARIVEACASPVSVAEVAARVGVPLGVAQILVGDLAEAGLVQVHEARQVATPALLLRMIDAVRAL